jgi:phosphotriesterase-related protein
MSEERRVQTVLGPVAPEDLGPTLVHEHFFIDHRVKFMEDPELGIDPDAPVTMELLGALRHSPAGVTRENLVIDDHATAVAEGNRFRTRGGGTFVDVTPSADLGRDPLKLKAVAEETGLNVIMGTGFYLERFHPDWVADAEVDELADLFSKEVVEGVEGTDVRAGIIGEIGTSPLLDEAGNRIGDMTEDERKVLRASARTALRTGVPVSVHVDLNGYGAPEIVAVMAAEGLLPERMIMGHMDLQPDTDYHRKVLATGAYVAYDTIGHEGYFGPLGGFAKDTWRAASLAALVADGHAERLLLSHDVGFKTNLVRYGGGGFEHIHRYFLDMLRAAGVGEEDIERMLVANPRRILTPDPVRT